MCITFLYSSSSYFFLLHSLLYSPKSLSIMMCMCAFPVLNERRRCTCIERMYYNSDCVFLSLYMLLFRHILYHDHRFLPSTPHSTITIGVFLFASSHDDTGTSGYRMEICAYKAMDVLLWRRWHRSDSVQHYTDTQVISLLLSMGVQEFLFTYKVC